MKVYIQCCEKCFLHKNYNHEQYDFHSQYAKIAQFLQKKNGIQVLKNNKQFILNNHLNKTSKSKKIYTGNMSDQLNFDLNSKGKPRIQSFQIYFKDLLVYSRLSCGIFPSKVYVCNVISVLQKMQETFYLKSILLKLGFQSVHQYIQYRLSQKNKDNKTIHYKEIYQILTQIDFIGPFRQKKQNSINQANIITISKKKKNQSQTFQCGSNKYQQFFQPIEQQDENSKVVTPNQIQEQEKQNQNKRKSKLLIKNKRSISKRKLSQESSKNLLVQNVKISSSKRSSQNKDKLIPPKNVNFAKRIRCKKFSTRYSNLNQKTEIINSLVNRQYNKIKQSKYQYLSKEMDVQVQYQNSTNQFVLQTLTDSQEEQNQSQIGNIFNRYKKKISNFANNHISSVSQPNLIVSGQLNDKSQSTSKPSFNNSIGLNSMIISQFQSKKINDVRPSILGGISSFGGSNQTFQPAQIIQSNEVSHLQLKNKTGQGVSCMSIQMQSQSQLVQQVDRQEKENIKKIEELKIQNQQQEKQINLKDFKESSQQQDKPQQQQDKNKIALVEIQSYELKKHILINDSIQDIKVSQTKKQEQQLVTKLFQQKQLKNSQVQKKQIQQLTVVQISINPLLTQIRLCLTWLVNNYLELLLSKFLNSIQQLIQIPIFNILSNKLQTFKITIEEAKLIKQGQNHINFGQNVIQLMQKILFQIYDKNMLKIEHIQLHTVQKILKTIFMFPTISMPTKKTKKCQKMIKSIFQTEKQENINCQNQLYSKSRKVCKIIGVSAQNQIQCFSNIQIDQNDFSKSILQSNQGKCLVFNFSSFCKKFQDVILWFANPSYFFQQQSIQFQEELKNQQTQNLVWYINMQIEIKSSKNSHLFMCFSSSLKNQQYTTVKIWKQFNALDQQTDYCRIQNKKKLGELIGQIKKKGDFFFQLDLDTNNYICEITKDQGFKNERLNISTYSDSILKLKESRFGTPNQINEVCQQSQME